MLETLEGQHDDAGRHVRLALSVDPAYEPARKYQAAMPTLRYWHELHRSLIRTGTSISAAGTDEERTRLWRTGADEVAGIGTVGVDSDAVKLGLAFIAGRHGRCWRS